MGVYRNSHQKCSVKKGVLRNFAKFSGKHLYQSLFFNKVAGLSPATLLKKRCWHRCFLVNFAKILRTPFLQNTSGRLLLCIEFLIHGVPYLVKKGVPRSVNYLHIGFLNIKITTVNF